MREITVGEFLDAVDKNGYPWGRMSLWNTYNGRACVMGQALLNLGYTPEDLHGANNNIVGDRKIGRNLNEALKRLYEGRSLIAYNDMEARTYEDVRKYAHMNLDPFKDKVIEFEDGR